MVKKAKPTNQILNQIQPIVFDYRDYRLFLHAYYQWRKSGPRGFSFRQFARLVGYSSPNYLKLVIEGQRNLAHSAASSCADALNLKSSHKKYFCKLVEFSAAKQDSERETILNEIHALIPHARKHQLGLEDNEYLSHWLIPVLREMVSLNGFNPDAHWISRRLRMPAKISEIEACLRTLVQANYIYKDEMGKYRTRDDVVVSTDDVRSFAIRNFHRKILLQSESVLDAVPISDREFAALTMLLPESKLGEMKERLKRFRDDLHDWAAQQCVTDRADTVMQFNFQVYPQTARLEKK